MSFSRIDNSLSQLQQNQYVNYQTNQLPQGQYQYQSMINGYPQFSIAYQIPPNGYQQQNNNNRRSHGNRHNNYRNNNNYRNTINNPDHFIDDENKEPIHTVFFFNIPFDVEMNEFTQFVNKFGEVSNIYPKFEKGVAFVTYYDIRDAIKSVKSPHEKIRDRLIKTAFAYRPPSHSRRDPRKSCSCVSLRLTNNNENLFEKISFDNVKQVMEQFGEIRDLCQVDDVYVVKYYNLKSAAKVVDKGIVEINNENCAVNYAPEEDEGEDPENHSCNNRNMRNNRNDTNNYIIPSIAFYMPPNGYPYPSYIPPNGYPPFGIPPNNQQDNDINQALSSQKPQQFYQQIGHLQSSNNFIPLQNQKNMQCQPQNEQNIPQMSKEQLQILDSINNNQN